MDGLHFNDGITFAFHIPDNYNAKLDSNRKKLMLNNINKIRHYTERHSTLFVALLQSFKLSLDSKKQDRCDSSLISLKGQGHHPAWLMCGYAAAFTEEELAQTSICNFLATIKQMKSALLLQSTIPDATAIASLVDWSHHRITSLIRRKRITLDQYRPNNDISHIIVATHKLLFPTGSEGIATGLAKRSVTPSKQQTALNRSPAHSIRLRVTQFQLAKLLKMGVDLDVSSKHVGISQSFSKWKREYSSSKA
eukprot:scaffold3198_cov213-Alexandrium_tamarense.AAC.28